ncbi:MAG: tripartite tricarboxylate transporter substrate binding protein [Burkholderiales bacterium]|nr:tripartite tricarboxylate transporter substrate binding protein [Burkholderiales bacterium]
MTTFRRALTGAAAVAALALAAPLPAQQWPTKPVKIVVPFPPGGSADPIARAFGNKLSATLGQQFIVENRAGASGSIGTGYVAKSPADGYTYVLVFDTHAVNPVLIPNLPFDTVRDLAPVMLVGRAPMALAMHPAKPYKSFADVLAAARARPATVNYGSVQNGSLGHLTMMLLQQAGGFSMVHVPYKGAAPMITDAVAGHIEMGIGSVAVVAPQVRGGKLRAVAVTGESRSTVLPEVPTLAEQGFPGFSAHAWWALFAPAGTPRPIIERLHAELRAALAQPDVGKQFAEQLGMQVAGSTPEELQRFLQDEMARWGKVVRDNNIRLE